jgi:ribosomal protein S18 acetylase RimI-like enzyme
MPDEVSIEPLQAADIPAVAELARAIWREHHVKFVSADQVEYMLRNKYTAAELAPYVGGTDRWLDVLRVGGTIGGFLRCIRKDPGELKLEEIYVSQALRGTGMGRTLLALADSRARGLGCSFVILYVNRANDSAVRAYRRAGFVVRRELVVDIGSGYVMDDFLMAKSLVDPPPVAGASRP